ncbi:MAG TPA: hypothetical protein EYH34_15190 [Planctomycetes bacterium]|nr:hypothetical protein [Anaerolineae bacterium]HIQ22568.1 hypothetical protein [Planctomycetota bacterium]
MKEILRRLSGIVCAAAICALVGCGGGEKLVTITGKLVDGGNPIKLEDIDQETIEEMGMLPIEVELWPVDASGNIDKNRKPEGASVELDGSFTLSGPEGDGIPAGRYRVALRYTAGEDLGMDEAEAEGEGPAAPWGDKFTRDNSTWEFDFQSDQEIVLDISAAGGGGGEESSGDG